MEQLNNNKTYQVKKIKNYIKTTKFFIIYSGIHKNSNDWLLTEQTLKKTQFEYHKVLNNVINISLKNSIYFSISSTISGIIFLVKPKNHKSSISKKIIINQFEKLLFSLIAIKINNKVYSYDQIKNISSLNYKSNLLVLFHSLNANVKFSYKKLKSK